MPPQQQNPGQVPSGNQTPYDFFMSSGQPAPQKGFNAGGSMKGRIIVAAVGAVLLILAIIIAISVISSGGDAQKESLTNLLSTQAKLVSVADVGATNARSPDIRNQAMLIKLSVQSEENVLLAFLKKQGIEVNSEVLTATTDTESIKSLETALQNNQFDATLQKIFTVKLTAYQQEAKVLYDSSSNAELKKILSDTYTSAGSILGPPSTQ